MNKLLYEQNFGQLMITNLMVKFFTMYPYSKEVVEYKCDVMISAIKYHRESSITWFQTAFVPPFLP